MSDTFHNSQGIPVEKLIPGAATDGQVVTLVGGVYAPADAAAANPAGAVWQKFRMQAGLGQPVDTTLTMTVISGASGQLVSAVLMVNGGAFKEPGPPTGNSVTAVLGTPTDLMFLSPNGPYEVGDAPILSPPPPGTQYPEAVVRGIGLGAPEDIILTLTSSVTTFDQITTGSLDVYLLLANVP